MSFVVDASLAFKWVLPEADSDHVRAFYVLHADQMHAPDLLPSESVIRSCDAPTRVR